MTVYFVAALIACSIALMKFAPDTLLSRQLRETLVERPARNLLSIRRAHVIYVLLMAGVLLVFSDMIMLLGSADLILAYAFDLSIYVDALLAVMTLAAAGRASAAATPLRRFVHRQWRAITRRLPRRVRNTRKANRCTGSANDDDHRWGFALAA